MYYIVRHSNEYAIKTDNNILYSKWSYDINKCLKDTYPRNFASASSLEENTIILSFNTFEELEQNYPELYI
jgi:hypothetical protein